MRLRMTIPDGVVNERTLGAALEATTVANMGLAARGELPDILDAIKKNKIKWKPEPYADGEHFDLAPVAISRGWGDCDDLAPWLCAQLRMQGVDCRPIAYRSAPNRWHAVVELANNKILDPSVWAGMKKPTKGRDNQGVHGMSYPPIGTPEQDVLAVVPHPQGGWGARADTALDDGTHLTSTAWSKTPKGALIEAVCGYIGYHDGIIGECVGEDYQEVGNFLSDIVKTVTPIASAALGPAAGLIAPVANAAMPLLSSVTSAFQPGAAAVQPAPPPPRGHAPGRAPAQQSLAAARFAPVKDGRGEGLVLFGPSGGPVFVRF